MHRQEEAIDQVSGVVLKTGIIARSPNKYMSHPGLEQNNQRLHECFCLNCQRKLAGIELLRSEPGHFDFLRIGLGGKVLREFWTSSLRSGDCRSSLIWSPASSKVGAQNNVGYDPLIADIANQFDGSQALAPVSHKVRALVITCSANRSVSSYSQSMHALSMFQGATVVWVVREILRIHQQNTTIAQQELS